MMERNVLKEAIRKGLDHHVDVYGDQIFPTDHLVICIAHAIELREGIEANARLAELSTEIHNSISRIRGFYTAVRLPGRDLTGQ